MEGSSFDQPTRWVLIGAKLHQLPGVALIAMQAHVTLPRYVVRSTPIYTVHIGGQHHVPRPRSMLCAGSRNTSMSNEVAAISVRLSWKDHQSLQVVLLLPFSYTPPPHFCVVLFDMSTTLAVQTCFHLCLAQWLRLYLGCLLSVDHDDGA